jgi:hypothetical protein
MKKSILTLATIAFLAGGMSAIANELHVRGRAGYYVVANTQKETTVAFYPGKEGTEIRNGAPQDHKEQLRFLLPRGRSGYVYR